MQPHKGNNRPILPSRSFLIPESRKFDPRVVRTSGGHVARGSTSMASFGALLGTALKKKEIPEGELRTVASEKGSRSVGIDSDAKPERLDRLRMPLKRYQAGPGYSKAPVVDLIPLSDIATKRSAPDESWNTSSRETFSSDKWRERSMMPTSSVSTADESSKLAPPKNQSFVKSAPSMLPPPVMKKYAEPLAGEVSTNFVRLNMKRRMGSYKSKQPSRDVKMNASALARKETKTREIDSDLSDSSQEDAMKRGQDGGVYRVEDKGGLSILGLDPVQLALEAVQHSNAAGIKIGKTPVKSSSYKRSLFKISSADIICKEITSRHLHQTTDKRKLSIQEKLSNRGGRAKFSRNVGCIEDEWLEKMAPKCSEHQMPASLLIVKKAGQNKGRRFYCCGFPRDEQCKFFLWAEDNPELLQLVAEEPSAVNESDDLGETWRTFALSVFHERLLGLDMTQLKREAKLSQARCRYFEEMCMRNGPLPIKYPKKVTLGGSKAEIIAKLTEEAYNFLLSEKALFEAPKIVISSDRDDDAIVQDASSVCSFEEVNGSPADEYAESDQSESDQSESDQNGFYDNNRKQRPVKRQKLAEDNQSSHERDNFVEPMCPPKMRIEENVFLSDSDSDCESFPPDDSSESENCNECASRQSKLEIPQSTVTSTRMNVDAVRLLCFGFDAFRDGQRWAIDRTLEAQRSLLILPTGGGKSLCFFLPAVILGGGSSAVACGSAGLTIVVSPLISLMEDQLSKLPVYAPGACFSRGISAVQVSRLTQSILNGFVRILFVSPERLCTPAFRHLIKKLKYERPSPVACFCVDEAHCLSQWSFNFRPSFLRIKRELKHIEPRSVIALTATATPDVEQEILEHLSIPPVGGVHRSPAKRYNLTIDAMMMTDLADKNEAILKILNQYNSVNGVVASKKRDSTIIYVWRRFETEVLVEYLKANGVSSAAYHAGMDSAQRQKTQELFNRGSIDVIVATVAFGMGVDKPNVRAVLHAVIPKSVESYIQEIGRAGRDGKLSRCFLLANPLDVAAQYSLVHQPRVTDFQIFAMIWRIFAPIFSNLSSNAADGGGAYEPCEYDSLVNFLSNPCVPHHTQLAFSLKDLEESVDISESTMETVLAILELAPFNFLEVDGARFDTVSGKFRNHSSTETIDRSDPLVNSILEQNEIKSSKSKRTAVGRRAVDEYGFETCDTWGTEIVSEADGNEESYGGAEFRVSLLALATKLRVDPDSVARISKRHLCSDISGYKFDLAEKLFTDDGRRSYLSLLSDWLWSVSTRVNKILQTNVDCAATRVLDMWRIGSMIAAVTVADIRPGGKVLIDEIASSAKSDHVGCILPKCFLEMSPSNRQKTMTDFVCDYYISHLAPRREMFGNGLYIKPSRCISSGNDDVQSELEILFYSINVPIFQCLEHDSRSPRAERLGLKLASDKFYLNFLNDIHSVGTDPRLLDTVETVLSAGIIQWGSSIDKVRLSIKCLYMAKIFHGLCSHMLRQQDWAHTGMWGRYINVEFDCIVSVARRYSSDTTDCKADHGNSRET